MLPYWLLSTAQIESTPGSRMLSGVSSWALVAIMFLAIFAVVIVVAGLLFSSIRRSRDQRRPGRVIQAGTPIHTAGVDPWSEAGRRTPIPPAADSDAAIKSSGDDNSDDDNSDEDNSDENDPLGDSPEPDKA
jgi:hypothetical protein